MTPVGSGVAKVCITCSKSGVRFIKLTSAKDGLSAQCAVCRSKYQREWYDKNRQRVVLYRLAWSKKNLSRLKLYRREHYLTNKERYAAKAKNWASTNRERVRDLRLRRKYGLTLEQYNAMVVAQAGRCPGCEQKHKRLFVDHNHATGAVRGLLCRTCNLILGMIETFPHTQAKLYAYAGLAVPS